MSKSDAMKTRAYVLLSGGVDSTTCLYKAAEDFDIVVGLSVNYGQRHAKEITYAEASCAALGPGVSHAVLDLASVVPRTMLTDGGAAIPSVSYEQIEGVSPTYVPFRNGLMLSAAAAHVMGARSREAQWLDVNEEMPEWALYFGAHAEDARAWAYPDCTPEFIGAMANAIYVGTYRGVRLHTPLEWLDKSGIIRLGESLNVDWRCTWSCYAGGEKHCGVCPTCRARRDGFIAAGVEDPTEYAAVPVAA